MPASTRIDGLDISFDQAPPAGVLPSNLSYREWNVRDPVPEDLVEVYDVVHIRNFCFILLDEEIPRILESLKRLLSKWWTYHVALLPSSRLHSPSALMRLA